jgi:NADH dehydrogenase/NADH:ubiquinone oxidoreductase subunit G
VMEMINLTIDGKAIGVEPGSTILDAARQAGVDIPVLCYFEHTTANGLCRLCLVEVEGLRGLQAACVVEAREGLIVQTRTENVERARRTILEMLAASVDISQAEDLQAVMHECRADPERFNGAVKRQPPLVDDNPAYIRDYAKCVLCWRCVQVCAADAQYTYAINFTGRGFGTQIGTFFDNPMPETTCVFCGQCVGVCPTGALKGKREFLFELGIEPEDVFEETRIRGEGKRSRKGPHLDRGG